ncbi:dihydrofolate reductase [Curvivirga aplysinae]|uniref:dihydrofolate reductase n=1 Tax=Curvivirga aplysinae TaxID=2529852 RepID=UPI001C3FE215|nr:dihydrofolate reductase [Curvivirga aplysinae]
MHISMIVAQGENRVIGVDGDLPWHLSEDLKYFKKTTMGKPIIMGRKTYESIGRPLPGRPNIVITRNFDYKADPKVDVVADIETAVQLGKKYATELNLEEIMIVGGAQIYASALPSATRLYITEVALSPNGDAYFPEFDKANWQEVFTESHEAEGDNPAYRFVTYEKSS